MGQFTELQDKFLANELDVNTVRTCHFEAGSGDDGIIQRVGGAGADSHCDSVTTAFIRRDIRLENGGVA